MIVFDSIYVHPLPSNHRFPMEKYDLLPRQLIYEGTIKESDIICPSSIETSNVERVHCSNYLEDLKIQRGNKIVFSDFNAVIKTVSATVIRGKNGSGKVFLRSAPAGTGIIAGGAIRSVCEVLGIQDVVAKSLGSANPHNVLKACVNGLRSQNSPKILSAIRGKKISDIVLKREDK